jgi:arylformamidase
MAVPASGIRIASMDAARVIFSLFRNSTMIRHPRFAGFALLVSTLLCGAPLAAQTKDKEPGAKEERPSQAAVLSGKTVVKQAVAFGKAEKQQLDVYSPKDAKGAPVVLFIHGGEWTKGDKADVSFKPKFFNENGVVFVSVNYRLSPESKHPAHVSDIAAAIRWVRDHADEIGAAGDKIFLMGHSAGCHLATLVALDPRHLAAVKLAPKDLRGVVAWSGGMYDLVERANGEGNYPKYIRQAFGETESEWRDASPVAHVGTAPMPPFLFAYIERKTEAKDGQPQRIEPSKRMVEAIRKAKGSADLHLLEGKTHFDANHFFGAPDDRTMGRLVLDFIRKNAN